ncbi:hypothetical protein PPROV_000306200 [Pycnococcus provasolii]|uniref:Uncharacterized protein n=1 Tax=Pycnococcus provasolii TaxID=41880 RepID=A0A830HC53_9CHLO|nr:hypothetical protein PPROV_000306200 [Pycnococcus provasolii]
MFRRATALMTVAALFAIPALFVPWYRACAPVENSRERTTQCAELVPLAVGQATFAAPWPLALLAVLPIAFAAAAHAVNFADTQLELDVCSYYSGRTVALFACVAALVAGTMSITGDVRTVANKHVEPSRGADEPAFNMASPGLYCALLSYVCLLFGGLAGLFFGERRHFGLPATLWRDNLAVEENWEGQQQAPANAHAEAARRLSVADATTPRNKQPKTAHEVDMVSGAVLRHIVNAPSPTSAPAAHEEPPMSAWRSMRRSVGKRLPEFMRLRWKMRAYNNIPSPASPLTNPRTNRHLAEGVSASEVVQSPGVASPRQASPITFTPPRDGESLRERYARHLRERDAAAALEEASAQKPVAATYPTVPPRAPPHFEGLPTPSAPYLPVPPRAPPHIERMQYDAASAPPASPELVRVVVEGGTPTASPAVAGERAVSDSAGED